MHRTDGLFADHLALGPGKTGNAEVHHLDAAVGQQHDVLGLDVPVDNALAVGMVQGLQDLGNEVDGLFPGERAAPLVQILFQGDAVDVFHDDILDLVTHRHVIHLDDMWVIQDRDRLGLVLEPLDQFRVFHELRPQDLDGHYPVLFQVAGTVYVGHTAYADQTFQQIAAVQPFTDHVFQILHAIKPPCAGARCERKTGRQAGLCGARKSRNSAAGRPCGSSAARQGAGAATGSTPISSTVILSCPPCSRALATRTSAAS